MFPALKGPAVPREAPGASVPTPGPVRSALEAQLQTALVPDMRPRSQGDWLQASISRQ